VKLELRAMTKSQGIRDSAVVMSSTMPSAKYSCSGSPDMFWNGNTAIDGLSGNNGGRFPDGKVSVITSGAPASGWSVLRAT
jgi:hypothetical protein